MQKVQDFPEPFLFPEYFFLIRDKKHEMRDKKVGVYMNTKDGY